MSPLISTRTGTKRRSVPLNLLGKLEFTSSAARYERTGKDETFEGTRNRNVEFPVCRVEVDMDGGAFWDGYVVGIWALVQTNSMLR